MAEKVEDIKIEDIKDMKGLADAFTKSLGILGEALNIPVQEEEKKPVEHKKININNMSVDELKVLAFNLMRPTGEKQKLLEKLIKQIIIKEGLAKNTWLN